MYSSTTQDMGRKSRSYTIRGCSDRSRSRCTNIYNWIRSKWTRAKMILVKFISFLTYMTRFKANMTLFMEKYTNKNAINFAESCFVYIKKSVVLLMIVTINLPNGCVKIIVLFCCLSLRHREWLDAENSGFVLRLHG